MYKEYLKIYLTRLKNTYVYKILLNNYFLIVLHIVFFLLSLNYWYLSILLLIFDFTLLKKSKEIIKISLLFSLLILINFIYLRLAITFNNSNNQHIEKIGYVYDIEKCDTYQKIIIKKGLSKTIIIDKDFTKLKIGNKIKINGLTSTIDSNHNENEFNYLEYLINNKYDCYIISKEIKIIKNTISLGIIKTYIDNYLNIMPFETKSFVQALLFAKSESLDEEFYLSLQKNGIIHLFAVSGLHISLFLGFFEKIYTKLKIKRFITYIINLVFLILYLVITDFTPSILRVSVSYIIKLVSEKNLKLSELSSLDIQSLSFIILITVNPYYMYNLGFILSYMASFTIILSSNIVSKKQQLFQTFLLSIFTMITSLPIVINMSYEINLLIPIINVIFISLVSYIILPITIIAFILPFFSKIYYYIILTFQKLSILVSQYFNVSINLPHFNILSIIIYYIIMIYIFKYFKLIKERFLIKKRIVYTLSLLVLFSLFIVTKNGFFCNNQMFFLDLENGDSTVIITNNQVVVIDTGDGTNNVLTNFLKSKGIKKIDLLVLSHNHNDHNGEANKLIDNFKVTNILVSAYDNSVITQELNCIKVISGDIINIGEISFEILNPKKKHEDPNDDSLVFVLQIFKKKILFVGDLTINGENEIMDKLYDIDILKVGHHGSKTSTSIKFLEKIKPEIAVIMTGRVEKFAFPHQEVIDNLNYYNIITYRTDKDYMITYKKNKFYTLRQSDS